MAKGSDISMVNFKPLTGNDLGVYHDKNFRLVECFNGHIVFSYAAKGQAMTAHFAADKKGLRKIKEAINGFCDWLFASYGCRFIYAAIGKDNKSIMRTVEKCGFNYLVDDTKHNIYVRDKS